MKYSTFSITPSSSIYLRKPKTQKLLQLPIHLQAPFRTIPPHSPNRTTAHNSNGAHAGKQPSVADDADEGTGDDSADAGKAVPDEIVGGDARGRFARHEFRQYRRGRAEDEHATNTEEEVGDELVDLEKVFGYLMLVMERTRDADFFQTIRGQKIGR